MLNQVGFDLTELVEYFDHAGSFMTVCRATSEGQFDESGRGFGVSEDSEVGWIEFIVRSNALGNDSVVNL